MTGLIFAFLAAFAIGFTSHRASICTVRAVAEIFTTRRFNLIASFLKTSIWVVSLSFIFLIWTDQSPDFQHWPMSLTSVAGGLLFGAGSAVNGGCTFSTITRLGDGDPNLAVTVLAWPLGAVMGSFLMRAGHLELPMPIHTDLPRPDSPMIWVILALSLGWVVWQLAVIMRPLLRAGAFPQAALAPQYRLTVAAAVMAIGNLLLYNQFRAWSFTSVTLSTVLPSRFPTSTSIELLWAVLLVALFGVFVSAILRKSFVRHSLTGGRIIQHGTGGLAMGVGAAMIPGGNDSLVLYGMASLSPHAFPAYAAILVGIALVFAMMKSVGAAVPPIRCSGDICLTQSPD